MESGLTKKPKTASEVFREAYSYYLSIGMPWDLYWEGPSWLVRSYRDAHKVKEKEINRNAWLNGFYVMQALQTGIPVVLAGMLKQHVDLPKFPDEPIKFEHKTEKEVKVEQEDKQMQLQVAKMHEMMMAINATFQRKQEEKEKVSNQ